MSRFETAFKAAIANNERRILISTLRASPDLTLGELHRATLGRLFSEITLGQLISGGGEAAPPARKATRRRALAVPRKAGGERAAKAPAMVAAPAGGGEAVGEGRKIGKRGGKAKTVNTHTSEGRAMYDEALFKALEQIPAPTVPRPIAKAGGTSCKPARGSRASSRRAGSPGPARLVARSTVLRKMSAWAVVEPAGSRPPPMVWSKWTSSADSGRGRAGGRRRPAGRGAGPPAISRRQPSHLRTRRRILLVYRSGFPRCVTHLLMCNEILWCARQPSRMCRHGV